ncbi:MAG TPA: carboxypeptidase regulatory-like domain-containing protein [Pyrinomonadaceae bacterium]
MNTFNQGRSLKSAVRLALAFCALLVLSSVPTFAQATKGTIRGTVADPNGQVIAGATVTAKNQNTGVESSTVTTGDGLFVIPELIPGQYTVTVESTAGFSKKAVTDVSVGIGAATNLPIVLAVGSPTEVVTVTSSGEELTLQKDESQIAATFDTRKIQDLPSNAAAGGLDTIALMAPGVIANNSGGVNTNGSGLSVNGNRARSNNFQIDGSDNNDLSVAGPANFVDNQDAVQEYQVITNNFSAQYGRNQGAIVNIVTKSGTNDFHGSLFWYHRDRKNFDSLDNIERASGQTDPNPSLFNVFGGTVGGPIYLPHFGEGGPTYISGKDRMFFYFAYQGVRNPSSTTFRSQSLGILNSEFPRLTSTFPGNAVISDIANFSTFAIPGASVNSSILGTPVATAFNLAPPAGCPRTIAATAAPPAGCGTYTAFVNPTTGQPFLTGGPFDVVNIGTAAVPHLFQAAQFQRNFSTPFNETDYNLKFDVRATNKDSVTVRYLKQSQNFINQLVGASSANGFQGDVIASSTNFGGSWTRQLSNSMVNEFRATYQRIAVVFGGGSGNGVGQIPDPTSIGSTITNLGLAGVTGIAKGSSAALHTIGPATNLPQGRIGKVYQYADNLTWTRGSHSFIFGGEYKHLTEVSPFLPNFNGAFGFNSATRVINNAPSSISITAGDPLISYSENDQYYFVQDDFKFRPNLTLNIGVRYEYTGQPINILNEITTARESNASTAFFNPALPLSIRTVPRIKPDKNNFAPRVGFAYTPHFWKGLLGEDATVIRGGFSMAYEPAFYNILQNVQNGAPFSVALSLPTALLPSTNPPFPIPGGTPTGDNIRAAAAASGILPLGRLNPLFLTQTKVAPDFHAPYSEQWSLGIQHQFGTNHVGEVRYVGTHGVGLFQNINGNFFVGPMYNGFPNWLGTGIDLPAFRQFIPAGITPQHCVNDPATFDNEAACNNRILRQSSVTVRANTATSIYHSMQSRYSGRFIKNSLSVNASYTWSKTIDNASEIFAFDIASANAQNPFCINKCERSLSQIDRPHAFSMNFIYDVPLKKDQRGILGHALGGWQFNGVYVLTAGEPYTPGQFFNGSLLGVGNAYLTSGDRPFVGNPSVNPQLVGISQIDASVFYGTDITNENGFLSLNALNTTGDVVPVTPNDVHFIFNGPGAAKVFNTPFGTATRNSLRGPRLNQLNMSVFKNTKVGEHVTFQIRAEAFNVLNHPNPGYGVNGNGYLPDFFVEDAGNPGGGFANNKDIEFARRVIQLGARIIF